MPDASRGAKCASEHGWCGSLAATAFFGNDGKLALDSDGMSLVKMSYDESENMAGCSFFGVDGNKVVPAAGKYARRVPDHDAVGRCLGGALMSPPARKCACRGGWRSPCPYGPVPVFVVGPRGRVGRNS